MLSPRSTHTTKECGCKGIRTCLLCRGSSNLLHQQAQLVEVNRSIYLYCLHCQKAWLKKPCLKSLKQLAATVAERLKVNGLMSQFCCHEKHSSIEFNGVNIIENFVTQEEENDLDKTISFTHFMESQSGRKKQDFGPKVNFKRQKLKLGTFNGLPSYSRFMYERMKKCEQLEGFEPVEMCNLEYSSDRGAHIDPHFDDFWIWGERLVTLNLISDSILSFTHDSHPNLVIQVPLLRRSLIVVSGPARYDWKHGIDMEHISGRRLAITFRELSDEFKGKGVKSEEGHELLKLALSFEGCAVGCAL